MLIGIKIPKYLNNCPDDLGRTKSPFYASEISALQRGGRNRAKLRSRTRLDLTPSALFRLDVGCPDNFAPLLGFVGEKLAELGWGEGSRRAAQVANARLDFGIGEGGGDLLLGRCGD